MTPRFSVSVENSPDVTGSVLPEVTRFDIYITGEHDTHADNEHSGFWGQIELSQPLPFTGEYFTGSPEGLASLRKHSQAAYWYATGLLDAATLMDDFEYNDRCHGCLGIIHAKEA